MFGSNIWNSKYPLIISIAILVTAFLNNCSSESNELLGRSKNDIFAKLSSSRQRKIKDGLMRFGYVGDEAFNSLREIGYEEWKRAVMKFQKFARIPVTGLMDVQTLQLLQRKRCGLPDISWSHLSAIHDERHRSKRYALQGSKWPRNNLTWSIKSWPQDADHSNIRREIQRALSVWSEVSKLSFTEVAGNGDIVISFDSASHGDDYPFDGPGGILAHAFFPMKTSPIGGDAHFDAAEKWGSGAESTNSRIGSEKDVSLFSVAAHEFGHSLGLSHSSVQGSLMYPYYQVLKDDFKLPYDDTVGIQQLYGSRQSNHWAPLPPIQIPSTRKPVTTLTTINPGRRPPSGRTSTTPVPDTVPDTCNTAFDAISSIRSEIFVFKGKYFWRLSDNKTLQTREAVEISRFWNRLPSNLVKIDAVYERLVDRRITFFIGKRYWQFSGNNPLEGYPRPLTDLGLPADLESIDAAMVWGHNGKTYLFSGSKYWRLEETSGKIEPDYPRDVNIWRGVPQLIDAAFTWHKNGITYFFKDNLFYQFDNRRMRVTPDSPKVSTDFWFISVCGKKVLKKRRRNDTNVISDQEYEYYYDYENSSNISSLNYKMFFLIIFFVKINI